MRMRPQITSLHRKMARQAQRELDRRKAGRRAMPGSDAALTYLVRSNPWASVDLSAYSGGLSIRAS